MFIRGRAGAIGIAVLMVLAAFIVLSYGTEASHGQVVPNGPWLDQVIWSVNGDRSQAVTDVLEGRTDIYYWGSVPTADRLRIRASTEAHGIYVAGRLDSIELNPIPQKAGGLNPFTIREVREALQYLVDRELIIRESVAGLGIPWVATFHPSSADYGRFADISIALEDKYAPNPQKAKALIEQGMTAAGATRNAEGKWVHGGQPVKIIFWARFSDFRLIWGRYVADLLEGQGFTVDFVPVTGAAIDQVYYGGVPVDQGLWHVYTGGWGGPPNLFINDGDMRFWHGCYWEGWCEDQYGPGGYKPPQDLADALLKIDQSNYTSLAERDQIIRTILPRVNEEAYRILLMVSFEAYAVNNRLAIGYDLLAGPSAGVSSRTAKIVGARCAYEGGSPCTARAVNLLAGQDVWNPYAIEIVQTYYDAVVRDYFLDSGMFLHPHTGRFIDNRNVITTQTAGPTGTLPVPATAVKFDTSDTDPGPAFVGRNEWVAVGSGVTATSIATVTPQFGKWHHGPQMSMDDFRAFWSILYRRAFGDVANILPNAAGELFKSFAPRIKGIEFTDTTYTIYLDYWNVDERAIAQAGSFWPQAPWEVEMTILEGVFDGEIAVTRVDAKAQSKIEVELTKGPASPSYPILDFDLNDRRAANARPAGNDAFITTAEATERWTALRAWVDARGHFWPSSGPFFLETFDPQFFTATLSAFRDYPFKADKYDPFLVPAVPDIVMKAPSTVFSGTPGIFDFSSTVAGTAYDKISVTWFLKDLSTGEFIERGTGATQLGAGAYRIELAGSLTERLLFGNFQLIVVVSSQDAAPPSVVKPAFLILPSVTYFEGLVSATESALQADITALETQQGSLRDTLVATQAATQNLSTLVTVLTILAVVAVIVSVVTLIRVLRRPPMKPMGEQAPPPM